MMETPYLARIAWWDQLAALFDGVELLSDLPREFGVARVLLLDRSRSFDRPLDQAGKLLVEATFGAGSSVAHASAALRTFLASVPDNDDDKRRILRICVEDLYHALIRPPHNHFARVWQLRLGDVFRCYLPKVGAR